MTFIQRLCVNKKMIKYYFCYVIIITREKNYIRKPFWNFLEFFILLELWNKNYVNLLMILLYLLFAYNMIFSTHESISTSNKSA